MLIQVLFLKISVSLTGACSKLACNLILKDIQKETGGSRINGLVKTDLICSKDMGNSVYNAYT